MSRDHTRRFSSPVTPAQVIGIGLVLASLGWAAWLLRDRPLSEEVELLPGTVLQSSDLAIIEAAFDRAQLIDHRTEDGRVWVPRQRQSPYMRALVDADALPREIGSRLDKAANDASPWDSPRVHEARHRVAMQEELARVICSMPGIERAAVFYDVDTKPAGTLGRDPVRTASVNIRTQQGVDLEPSRVQAIRVLVAAAIAGLTADRVAVTDLRGGRVFAGPMTVDAGMDIAAVDPDLARQVAHEEHLATKLRQALAYVKGAVIDVTVTFSPLAPRLPPEPVVSSSQHVVAGANTPAAVGDQPPVNEVPSEAISDTAAAAILVSLAVPDEYFAGLDKAAADAAEARLREHVLSIVPATSRPQGRRLVLTRIGSSQARHGRGQPSSREVSSAPSVVSERDERHVSLEAAWKAILDGRAVDVPREVWLAVIAVAAGLLGMLVLRPRRTEPRVARPARRPGDRIDWSGVDGDSADATEIPQRTAA